MDNVIDQYPDLRLVQSSFHQYEFPEEEARPFRLTVYVTPRESWGVMTVLYGPNPSFTIAGETAEALEAYIEGEQIERKGDRFVLMAPDGSVVRQS